MSAEPRSQTSNKSTESVGRFLRDVLIVAVVLGAGLGYYYVRTKNETAANKLAREAKELTFKDNLTKLQEAEVKLKERRAWFTVLEYSEYSANGRLLHDVTVRLRPDEVPLEKAGQATSKLREDIERGVCSWMVDGEMCAFDYFVVPDQAGDFRASVRVWKGRKSP